MGESLSAIARPLLDELVERHSEAHRAYHAWSHVEALLAHYRALTDRFADPLAVKLAILFHDAVYDPRASDNEVQSAELLVARMAGQVPAATLERARQMVLATQAHALPTGIGTDEIEDIALFLDMDLAILGAATDHFDRYEAGVRHEYAHVPDAAFRVGRAAILERFADRPRLYFSAWGQERFEAPARANIARSLAKLHAG